MNNGPSQKRLREESAHEESADKRERLAESADNLSSILTLPDEILQMIFAYTAQATKTVPDQALVRISRQFRNQFGSFLMWRNGLRSNEQINQALLNQQATIQYLVNNKEHIQTITMYNAAVAKCFDKLLEATVHKMDDGCSFMVREELINQLNAAIIRSRINQSTDKTRLDCSNCHLTCFPASVLQDPALQDYWAALTSLRLNDNRIATLPPEIGQLRQLQYLFLHANQLSSLPAEIGQLVELQQLFLHNNQLTALPSQIGQLVALKGIILSNNKLTTLPAEIGQLVALNSLFIKNNLLSTLPTQIGQLQVLTILVLSSNKLTTLPKEIGLLASLNQLYLCENRLTTLPEQIGQLATLNWLSLRNNQLTTLPAQITQLRALTWLCLSHNQLTHISPDFSDILFDVNVDNEQQQNRKITVAELMSTQTPPQFEQVTVPESEPEQKRLRNG